MPWREKCKYLEALPQDKNFMGNQSQLLDYKLWQLTFSYICQETHLT